MKIFIKDVQGLVLPSKATPKDAGYDLVATTPPKIVGESISRPYDGLPIWKRVAYIEYGTNIFIAPQDVEQWNDEGVTDGGSQQPTLVGTTHYHTLLFPRSSISKQNLVLANSVATIDNEYRGQIFLRFKYIFQPEDFVILPEANVTKVYGIVNPDYIYNQGDKIVQLQAHANVDIDFEVVKDLNQTIRGDRKSVV